jgi:hypothetical protein
VSTRRAVAAAIAVLVSVCLVLTAVTGDPWPSNDGLTVLVLLVLGTVGLVIVRKQPQNAVGWLFAASALIGLVDTADRLYLVLDYRRHAGGLPLGAAAADWRGGVTISALLVGLPAILVFPDGKIPPPRAWRIAAWAYALLTGAFVALQFGSQAIVGPGRHVVVDIRGNLPNINPGTVAGVAWFVTPFFLAFWLASVGYQVASWRRATGERRAQLNWLMGGATVCVVSSVTLVMTGDGHSTAARIAADVSIVGIGLLPVAIGVGILRYRLYEIDRLISRTLSYALLSGALIGVFVGSVLLTTRVLPVSSPVGVAASTLAAAALFSPLRGRLQRFVDRRFNRARYDAEKTVAAFTTELRRAIDIDALRDELLGVVDHSIAPAHTSLWLRAPPREEAQLE